MNDLMVDIETLGTGQNSVITQIGACYFDRHTAEVKETFLVNVQIQDCLNHGLGVDAGALKFWFGEIFKRGTPTFLKEPLPLSSALGQLKQFAEIHTEAPIWSHACFDFGRLDDGYGKLGQKLGFSYRRLRDIRTLVDLSGIKRTDMPKEDKTHDALDDCKRQVRYCTQCFNFIRGKK